MHAAAIPPDWDRAIAYGDGLFETVAVFNAKVPLWLYHRQRLQTGCRRLQIACDIDALEHDFLQTVARNPDALIKIIVARSGGKRGYDSRNAVGSAISLVCYPLPRYSDARRNPGIRLHLCRQRLSDNPGLAGLKHLNRMEQVSAASEWDRSIADEGLMLDASGAAVECTMSNIFAVNGNTLLTPRLDRCGVEGVMRAAIIQQFAPALSMSVHERRLTIASLLSADAVFVCNSVFGIWPVCAIGVSEVAQSPELIDRFWQQLADLGYKAPYG